MRRENSAYRDGFQDRFISFEEQVNEVGINSAINYLTIMKSNEIPSNHSDLEESTSYYDALNKFKFVKATSQAETKESNNTKQEEGYQIKQINKANQRNAGTNFIDKSIDNIENEPNTLIQAKKMDYDNNNLSKRFTTISSKEKTKRTGIPLLPCQRIQKEKKFNTNGLKELRKEDKLNESLKLNIKRSKSTTTERTFKLKLKQIRFKLNDIETILTNSRPNNPSSIKKTVQKHPRSKSNGILSLKKKISLIKMKLGINKK